MAGITPNPGYGGMDRAPGADAYAKARVGLKDKIEAGELFTGPSSTTEKSRKMNSWKVWELWRQNPQQPSSTAGKTELDIPVTTIQVLDPARKALDEHHALRNEDKATRTAERRAQLMQTAAKVMAVIAVGTLLFAFMGMTGGFQHAPLLNNPLIGGALAGSAVLGILGASLGLKGRSKENEIDDKRVARLEAAIKALEEKEYQRIAALRDPESSVVCQDDVDTVSNSSGSSRASSPTNRRPMLVLTNIDDIRKNEKALRKLEKVVSGAQTYATTTDYRENGVLVLKSVRSLWYGKLSIKYFDDQNNEIGLEILSSDPKDFGILGPKIKDEESLGKILKSTNLKQIGEIVDQTTTYEYRGEKLTKKLIGDEVVWTNADYGFEIVR